MESLTSRLSNLEIGNQSLWVVPASEVRRRKIGDAPAALKEFGANLVITGAIQRQGALVRLTINLIDARDLRQAVLPIVPHEVAGVEWRLHPCPN